MVDIAYALLLRRLLDEGEQVETRNSRCRRLIACRERFTRFPLVSLRTTAWRTALYELEWFLRGGAERLVDAHPSVHPWWSPWVEDAVETPGLGVLRHGYGSQLRSAAGHDGRVVDQIQLLIDGITEHPSSRRNVVTTWNTADMTAPDCKITTCWGTVIQAFVSPETNALHLVTYQRSADVVCGLPHNWVQAWALLMWLAHRGGREVGSLTWMGGDVHLYETHEVLARRVTRTQSKTSPNLVYRPSARVFLANDFTLDGEYVPTIRERAEMVI